MYSRKILINKKGDFTMATSNQDTNIKDVAAPASATTTNIGHLLGLNAAKTQDVLIPLSMLRTVIAAELKTALAAITSGSPDVPVLDGNNLKYMTLANFAKVVGEPWQFINTPGDLHDIEPRGLEVHCYNTGTLPTNAPSGSASRGGCIVIGQASSPKLLIWIDQTRNMWVQASWYGAYSAWTKLI